MEKNKKELKTEAIEMKLIKLLDNMYFLLNFELKEATWLNKLVFLLSLYFSNFKSKCVGFNEFNTGQIKNIVAFFNAYLEKLNSKYLIVQTNGEVSKLNYINLSYYLLIEFDIINEFIEYISKVNKLEVHIHFKQILKVVEADETYENNNLYNAEGDNILANFNKLNFLIKDVKKQLDLFVNLSYKLNKIKNLEEKPIKYIILTKLAT